MNNLKKFTTEAEYSAATLNYPAVSWVTSGDTVHFDKSGSTPTVNDKVMMAWHTFGDLGGNDKDIVMYNGGSSIRPMPNEFFNSITLNDVDVMSSIQGGVLDNYAVEDTTYVAKYDISGTSVNDYFAGELGGGFGSDTSMVEILVPAQITAINHLPNNLYKLVVEATTPPTIAGGSSAFANFAGVYVPDASVTAYQNAWGSFASQSEIHPISQYSGNLPV